MKATVCWFCKEEKGSTKGRNLSSRSIEKLPGWGLGTPHHTHKEAAGWMSKAPWTNWKVSFNVSMKQENYFLFIQQHCPQSNVSFSSIIKERKVLPYTYVLYRELMKYLVNFYNLILSPSNLKKKKALWLLKLCEGCRRLCIHFAPHSSVWASPRSLPLHSSYLQTSSLLASDHHLTEEERKHFCQEILDFASQPSDNPGKTSS